ncbi:AAA family ATPase [Patescibacteria group bacterium]|nr:AAA family ATPase [Patescibacteria group bacterium]
MPNKLICLVGLPGAGKTLIADYLMVKRNFGFIRFGQITLDWFIKRGRKPTEKMERKIREDLRRKHGMAAFAKLNVHKINLLLKEGDVIGEGLYSWEEYLYLKNKYKDRLIVIAVYASPQMRQARLVGRGKKHGKDAKLQFRSFTKAEAEARDRAQIENLHQAGPIVMADYTLLNVCTIGVLHKQIDVIIKEIYG